MNADDCFVKVAVPVPLTPLDLCVDYRVPEGDLREVAPGCLVDLQFGRQKIWGVVFKKGEPPGIDIAKIKAFSKLKLARPIFDQPKLDLLTWMSRHYFYPIGEVCETAIPAPIRTATDKILLKERSSASRKLKAPEDSKVLNEAQDAAVQAILANPDKAHLLWGITGSGKTEVYLQAIAQKLSEGKSAIVLVPEISLTPQLTDRFEKRFPGEVAIFHSGLKPKQIREAWLDTFDGKKRIAVGPRSALFAPMQNLGIVIVDEEHDGSYKQEDRLRYSARDCALKLGEFAKVPVVLGSATPSAESIFAVKNGAMLCSKLPERAAASARLPEIQIVDLKKGIAESSKVPLGEPREEMEIPQIKGDFFLSGELRLAIAATLAEKRQTILFLNRRGLGSQELCRVCGHIPECPNCDVNLTPHLHALLCHYCGYEISSTADCPECKATEHPFIRVGIGTEAVEEALKFHFPEARVLRLDRDTTTSAEDYERVIEGFRAKEADILVGTQMVAKGHDFPEVTLVGILLAEMGLSVPDYRANERCLQLLLQVSGRAGRALHPGQVILQTFQPEHPVLQSLLIQKSLEDYELFINRELAVRQALHYPPHGTMALLRFDALDSDDVAKAADMVASALKRIKNPGLQILGPTLSPLSKIRGRHRWQILLKADSVETSHKAISWILETWNKQKLEKQYRARLVIDMDPMSML